MEKNYLLPNRFKKVGMIMFIPFTALSLIALIDQKIFHPFEIPVLQLFSKELSGDFFWFKIEKVDPTVTIILLGLLISLCFIALSREKDEDEMTGQIRMQSFVWSLWVTAFILAFGILFTYFTSFMTFTFIAFFLYFIIYVLKFNLTMKSIRRNSHEK